MKADIQYSMQRLINTSYFTGKLVRDTCSGSSSIQLLAVFAGIYFPKFAKIKCSKISCFTVLLSPCLLPLPRRLCFHWHLFVS